MQNGNQFSPFISSVLYFGTVAIHTYQASSARTGATDKSTRKAKEQKIKELIREFMQTGIEEIENIAYLLERNQILHYFIAKETNAKAEALNQNLQRFINVNYGARNTDFFLYRVKVHFT